MLAAFAATLPCRTIFGERGAYLSRYTLDVTRADRHVYLHFFHRGDADRTLHNHPWSGRSLILTGGYREERRDGAHIVERIYVPGDVNTLDVDTFHRVDLLDPRGAWTLFETGARVQSWGFWDRDSDVFTPWRDALTARGLVPIESLAP